MKKLDEVKIEKLSRPNDRYEDFLVSVTNQFNKITAKAGVKLFRTNATGLFDIFLNNLPEDKQHYTCRTCMQFVDRFGDLVAINEKGAVVSAIWAAEVPEFFQKSVDAMREAVLKAEVLGVFVSNVAVLGQPIAGGWDHMAVKLPSTMVSRDRINTPFQIESEKREDFNTLMTALKKYSLIGIEQAITLLQSEALYRSDKCLGVAVWFKEVKVIFENTKNETTKTNKLLFKVATAPVGFCHISSTMIGTLLDDIADGLDADVVAAKFKTKMDPATHMRAQVAPSQGNIDRAEKIVKDLGVDLRRRYATYDELEEKVWESKIVAAKKSAKPTGVFGSVVAREKEKDANHLMEMPNTTMTWSKFERTVLNTAESIEAKVEDVNRLMALVTAVDADAPNILKWGNPFSWYYHGGVDAEMKKRVEAQGGRYEDNDIRCTLIWDGRTDLDLHCITPNGNHIYWSERRDRYNGFLDIDANGQDGQMANPVENIRWPSGYAQDGIYKFYVHNYNQRDRDLNNFKVELNVNGVVFSCTGSGGYTKSQHDVFEFRFTKGQAPVMLNGIGYGTTTVVSENSWNVTNNAYVKVKGIVKSPNLWGKELVTSSGNHTFFILEGCQDLTEGRGRGFFSEMLKSEFHEVRKTLEAYCANTPIESVENASACGLGFSKENDWNLLLKVTSNNSTRVIKIDRFD